MNHSNLHIGQNAPEQDATNCRPSQLGVVQVRCTHCDLDQVNDVTAIKDAGLEYLTLRHRGKTGSLAVIERPSMLYTFFGNESLQMVQFSIVASAPVLVLATALGYAAATVGMKLVSQNSIAIGALILAAGIGAAILAEITLLRKIDLSVVYIAIVASETLLVLIYAAMIGEGIGLRQTAGAALVVIGLIAVST